MTRRRAQNDIFGLCQRPAVRKRGDAPAGFCAEKTGLKTRRAGVLAGGPRLSKAKAGQAKTSAPVGPMTGCAVSRSEMRPNGSKRRGFGRGTALEQSESGAGQNIGPGGADDRPARFRGAKCDRMGASAGVLPLGTRRGGAVTGTAKHRPRWGR